MTSKTNTGNMNDWLTRKMTQLNVLTVSILNFSSNKITDAPQGVTLDLTQKVTDVRSRGDKKQR